MAIKVFASGQSNLLGIGTGGPALSGVSADVSVWNNINPLGANGTAFVTAAAAQAAGVFQNTDRNNFAVWFCDKLARAQFDTVTLAVVALGGGAISMWAPGATPYPMLQECIDVWAATGQAPADVFLWDQGEADTATDADAYREAFEALVSNLIAADVINADTTIIITGIAGTSAALVTMGNTLKSLAHPRNRGFASAYGLPTSDGAHFLGSGLHMLGARRCFAAYTYAIGRKAGVVGGGGGGTPFRFGIETTGGTGNWGTATDRAMFDRATLATPGTAKKIGVFFTGVSTAGTNMKGLIYSDSAGAPGSLVAVGSSIAIPAGGGWVESTIADVPLTAGDYWLGFVADENTATADSGTSSAAPHTVLLNGTFSFASPPSTAPGADADYVPDLSVYCEVVG